MDWWSGGVLDFAGLSLKRQNSKIKITVQYNAVFVDP
jgi:hypothetical protein